MAVKMRPTDSRTKRPREALLQLDTEVLFGIVENRRECSSQDEYNSEIPLVLYRISY